jgi:hypothetical protein
MVGTRFNLGSWPIGSLRRMRFPAATLCRQPRSGLFRPRTYGLLRNLRALSLRVRLRIWLRRSTTATTTTGAEATSANSQIDSGECLLGMKATCRHSGRNSTPSSISTMRSATAT